MTYQIEKVAICLLIHVDGLDDSSQYGVAPEHPSWTLFTILHTLHSPVERHLRLFGHLPRLVPSPWVCPSKKRITNISSITQWHVLANQYSHFIWPTTFVPDFVHPLHIASFATAVSSIIVVVESASQIGVVDVLAPVSYTHLRAHET